MNFYTPKLHCNNIEQRKLDHKFKNIETERKHSFSKLKSEEQFLKLKYNQLICGPSKDTELTRSFLNIPGFRYRFNGKTRPVQDPKALKILTISDELKDIAASILDLSDDKFDNDMACISKVATVNKDESNNYKRKLLKTRIELNRGVKEIEKTLKDINSDKDLKNIDKKLKSVKKSLTFLQAHSNENTNKEILPINSEGIKHDRKTLLNRQTKIKQGCVACQLKLKPDVYLDIVKKRRQKMGTELLSEKKTWYPAPSGVFLSESSPSLKRADFTNMSKTTRKIPKSITTFKHEEFKDKIDAELKIKTNLSNLSVDGPNLTKKHEENENFFIKIKAGSESQIPNQETKSVNRVDKFSGESSLSLNKIDDFNDLSQLHTQKVSSNTLTIALLKSKLKRDKTKTACKINSFIKSLPSVIPSITNWHTTNGVNKYFSVAERGKGNKYCFLPATNSSEHQKQQSSDEAIYDETSQPDNKFCVSKPQSRCTLIDVQGQIFSMNQHPYCEDSENMNELKKCRYLRIPKNKSSI